MGTFNDRPGRGAFSGQVFPKGIDLSRSKIETDEGTWEADPSAVIRAGQFVALNSGGLVVPSVGADTLGISKWNKQQFGISVRVDVPITLPGTTAVFVGRANISNVAVRSQPLQAGTLFATPADYTINAAAGTITRVALGAIADGQLVYVSFVFQLTDADFEFDGRDFRNQANNDVSGNEGRLAVITNWTRLATMEWDSSVSYSLTGATSRLFVSAEGKATTTGGTDFAGRVSQIPRNDDPYLEAVLHGDPV